MTKRPENGRALFYHRDSGGAHENTPGQYVLWAQRFAQENNLTFTGTPAQIDAMIRDGSSHDGDMFLDYGVKGNQLSRPGLDALFDVALTDTVVSHILIPRRDRFARPEDQIDGLKLERQLRNAGLTMAYMNRLLPPSRPGKQDICEDIVGLIDYNRAGGERRDLAQKIIYAQLELAKSGFSTGGRAPYGFRRLLVDSQGTKARLLADGEYVQMPGHHVVWVPGPDVEMKLIRRILTMLETMPASRVAATLTNEGIPSPDANRTRIDRGVRHRTSGVWHQTTIVGIARNPLLRAVVEYGRRSMGDQLRFTKTGPRELDDSDRKTDLTPKVIRNPLDSRITAPARFEPIFDPVRHENLLKELDRRGGTQRGKARSRDPMKNPLGGRIFDMGCGWLMYRQPYGKSFRYLCGLYQQSHGAKCEHNHIDGMVAAKFLLGCLRQKLFSQNTRQRVEAMIRVIARRKVQSDNQLTQLAAKKAELAAMEKDLKTIEKNLARAENDDQYRSVAADFELTRQQQRKLTAEVQRLQENATNEDKLEAEISAASAGMKDIETLATSVDNLAALSTLFSKTNARLYLQFEKTRKLRRVINRVSVGVVTFGETPSPIPLYKGPTGRRQLKCDTNGSGVASPKLQKRPGRSGRYFRREDESLGNISRGERI